jgi:hypothetical protein
VDAQTEGGRAPARRWRARAAGALVTLLATGALPAAGPAWSIAGGTPAATGTYGFVAQLRIGTFARACTGALIDPEWVVTARSCFAENGQPVPAGPPAQATTVTVGKNDLTAAGGGQARAVTTLVPHADRDVVLAKLATPVIDVTPIPIAATAPAAGESLQVAGFGRTATTWAPEVLHTATLAVQTVGGTTLDLSGPPGSAAVCKGDAGGPSFRGSAGTAQELVSLHTSSTQSGCLGVATSAEPALATDTRLDDIADWLRQTVRGGAYTRLPNSAAVLDTRSGIGAKAGVRAANSVTTFPVAGVGGVPATGVTAVMLDVTAVTTTSAAHLTVYPDGTTRNTALSMVNATANQTISNGAVVNLGANGRLAAFTGAGGVHIVIDVQGYFTGAAGGHFVPVTPTRLVDTRSGLGGSAGTIPSGGSRTFTVTGGVIPAGAQAAFLDLIATGATKAGWVGTYASGGTTRSVMDFVVGTTAHAITAKLGADGRATFTNNSAAPIHIVLTASGYYAGGLPAGGGLRTLAAARKLDTRTVGSKAPLAANAATDIALGVPAGATALVNLTVVNNTATGYLRAWPAGGTEPTISWVNYPGANTGARAGLAAIRVGAGGRIRVKNVSAGTAHLLVDVQGWYAEIPGPPVRPA